MTNILGFSPIVRNSDEDEAYFCAHPEVKAMPVYPDSGSIKVIDDTIVIKFEDCGYKEHFYPAIRDKRGGTVVLYTIYAC